jgi:hypothetical protein
VCVCVCVCVCSRTQREAWLHRSAAEKYCTSVVPVDAGLVILQHNTAFTAVLLALALPTLWKESICGRGSSLCTVLILRLFDDIFQLHRFCGVDFAPLCPVTLRLLSLSCLHLEGV